MTRTTKIVIISASILVTGSILLAVYSSDKQKQLYNAMLTNPDDAINQINKINAAANITVQPITN